MVCLRLRETLYFPIYSQSLDEVFQSTKYPSITFWIEELVLPSLFEPPFSFEPPSMFLVLYPQTLKEEKRLSSPVSPSPARELASCQDPLFPPKAMLFDVGAGKNGSSCPEEEQDNRHNANDMIIKSCLCIQRINC